MNILRKEIEPNLEVTQKIYPKVLELILGYTAYCDENGNENNIEYQKLENKLNVLASKDTSKFNLWEWWEEEGAEVLSFRIALPHPVKVKNISKEEEVTEIVRRIKTFEIPTDNDESFKALFQYYLDDYYHAFLKLNFKNYEDILF